MKNIVGKSLRHQAAFKIMRTEKSIVPAGSRRQAIPASGTAYAMRGSSGQVLWLVTLFIVVLFAFAGFAVDVGQEWSVRRNMQTAADAAAIAGAVAVRLGNPVTAPAQAVAKTNGFTDSSIDPSSTATVTVNNPPLAGAFAGNASYVEVIVSQPQPTYFLQALGYTTMPVSARSTASSVNGPACLYALDPSASSAASFGGSSTTTLSCGAIVDSSSSSALTSNGGGTLTASDIGVVGGFSCSGCTPTPVSGVAPARDPLAYLQAPTVGGCDYHNLDNKPSNCVKNGVASYCFSPGVYCGGIKIDGNINVFFSPGVYILEGGMKDTANVNISGTGVMFYNSNVSYGAIDLSGANTVNLSAPTSGPYAGILFFQDRSVPLGSSGSKITGGTGSTFDGSIYFSTTSVTYSGNSSSGGYTIIVADTVSVSGSSTLLDNYSSLPGGDPIKATSLYE